MFSLIIVAATTQREKFGRKKTQVRIFAMFREQAHLIDDMKSI